MTDNIVRLLRQASFNPDDYRARAADEIERLRLDARAYANVMLSEENDALIEDNKLLRAEIERLRSKVDELEDVDRNLHDMRVARDGEIERLRTALQQIVTEADSDDGLTAWDGADIARRALGAMPQ
jgi:predicted nuclease with TOPRIM domain